MVLHLYGCTEVGRLSAGIADNLVIRRDEPPAQVGADGPARDASTVKRCQWLLAVVLVGPRLRYYSRR